MITERIVPENERLDFFPAITRRYIHLEAYSYNLAEKYIADYSGAYYEFVELHQDNSLTVRGRFTFSETDDGLTRLVNPNNYCDVTLSNRAAGIALFMMVYSDYANLLYKSCPDESQHFTNLYFQLRDYACEHHESDKIFTFLD